jgi:hypothetical protein
MLFKMFTRGAGLRAALTYPLHSFATSVTIDAASPVSTGGGAAFGIHTSVYSNINQCTVNDRSKCGQQQQHDTL